MRKFAAVLAVSLGVAGQAMAADVSSAVLSADPMAPASSILVSRDGHLVNMIGSKTTLHQGDRVIVRKGTGASLAFADRCVVRVAPGSMVTIGSKSPCSDVKGGFQQVANPCQDGGGWSTGEWVFGAVVLVGAGVAIYCVATGCTHNKQFEVSP
jgi:hypothetical protein